MFGITKELLIIYVDVLENDTDSYLWCLEVIAFQPIIWIFIIALFNFFFYF